MTALIDTLSWVLLTLGGLSVLIGGIGALRMPDLYTRMHAASVTDSMGAILVLVGIMLQAGWSLATIKLIAILLFLLLTSPTSSYALASAALLAGTRPYAEAQQDEEETT
ncbi:MAG TPA: monovalent cation/H(+) antiporter subunit G [Woeseiaceae bacterium]|nr:monovalent cation/H(+) antiporter subunit G [Woeseiaceae bacterium]